jgi:Tfp pilus assembly protein PilF
LQLGNLGYASVQANQLGQAVLRYRQALHLAYQSEDRDNIVSAIVDLVRLLVESKRHLTVAELLIEDALKLEPTDRDVNKLKERITNEKILAQANGVEMIAVSGSAEQYAANAYTLLDE